MVPQFPQPPGKLGEDEKPSAPPAPKPPEKKVSFEEKKPAAEDTNGQKGLLTWITTAMPQSPVMPRRNSEEALRPGLVGSIVTLLEKVVPQPEGKNKDTEEVTEVGPPDAEPLPHIPVVEVVSDEEPDNEKSSSEKVTEWIKQAIEKVVPQPELQSKPEPPPPPPPKEEEHPNVVGWIVQGIERILPHPPKPGTEGEERVKR